jgi:hypothetical protein
VTDVIPVPLLLGEGTPLFAGEQAELIAEGNPVAGSVTHLRFRVRDYGAWKVDAVGDCSLCTNVPAAAAATEEAR